MAASERLALINRRRRLVTSIQACCLIAIADFLVTDVIGAMLAYWRVHSDIIVVLCVVMFMKLIPGNIISILTLSASTYESRVDAAAGWAILMVLVSIVDIGLLYVGFKHNKKDEALEDYSTNVERLLRFLMVYKIFYIIFTFAAICVCFAYINHPPPQQYAPKFSRRPNRVNSDDRYHRLRQRHDRGAQDSPDGRPTEYIQ